MSDNIRNKCKLTFPAAIGVAKAREIADIYVPSEQRAQVFTGVQGPARGNEDLVHVHLGGSAHVVGRGGRDGGNAHTRDEAVVHAWCRR